MLLASPKVEMWSPKYWHIITNTIFGSRPSILDQILAMPFMLEEATIWTVCVLLAPSPNVMVLTSWASWWEAAVAHGSKGKNCQQVSQGVRQRAPTTGPRRPLELRAPCGEAKEAMKGSNACRGVWRLEKEEEIAWEEKENSEKTTRQKRDPAIREWRCACGGWGVGPDKGIERSGRRRIKKGGKKWILWTFHPFHQLWKNYFPKLFFKLMKLEPKWVVSPNKLQPKLCKLKLQLHQIRPKKNMLLHSQRLQCTTYCFTDFYGS